MAQFLGFGNGSDGVYTVSSPTTYAPIDSSCSGASGSTSLSATNVSFTGGQFILVHQSRGTGAGQWEINKISSYSTGTITTVHPLSYTYTDSGDSQAQVIVIPQYSGITISSTLTTKTWTGDVGGIIPLMCTGVTNLTGSITAAGLAGTNASSVANGGGFRGGATSGFAGANGESITGAGQSNTTSNNGSGGGGGDPNGASGGGGAGGGSVASGTNGSASGDGTSSTAGTSFGSADLTSISFGGAGGSGGGDGSSPIGMGGNGGGIIILFTNSLLGGGTISANGGAGGTPGIYKSGGGGGGAGGSIFIKTKSTVAGTNLITATGGSGGAGGGAGGAAGGAGSNGRIRIESCSLTGTTNPSASTQTGGHSFCGGTAFLF